METLANILIGYLLGFVDLVKLPWTLWQWWELGSAKARYGALILGGMSSEFLFMVLALMSALFIAGLFRRNFMAAMVHGLEQFNGRIGQYAAWFTIAMMIQQVLLIVVTQVFRSNEIMIAPLGMEVTAPQLQWLAGQLKFYNSVLIAFGAAYTFIEGGHVRVDLVYAAVSYRVRKWIDLLGTIFFFFPSVFLMWWFAWPLAMNSVFSGRPVNLFSEKASWRGFKWEDSGSAEFTWVWAFKVLILVLAALLIVQAFTFLCRNALALMTKEEIPTHPRLDGVGEGAAAH